MDMDLKDWHMLFASPVDEDESVCMAPYLPEVQDVKCDINSLSKHLVIMGVSETGQKSRGL